MATVDGRARAFQPNRGREAILQAKVPPGRMAALYRARDFS